MRSVLAGSAVCFPVDEAKAAALSLVVRVVAVHAVADADAHAVADAQAVGGVRAKMAELGSVGCSGTAEALHCTMPNAATLPPRDDRWTMPGTTPTWRRTKKAIVVVDCAARGLNKIADASTGQHHRPGDPRTEPLPGPLHLRPGEFIRGTVGECLSDERGAEVQLRAPDDVRLSTRLVPKYSPGIMAVLPACLPRYGDGRLTVVCRGLSLADGDARHSQSVALQGSVNAVRCSGHRGVRYNRHWH